MTNSNDDPILKQIPLIISPGTYKKPKTVSLPYNFESLPKNIDNYEEEVMKPLKDTFKSINKDQSVLIDKVKQTYQSQDVAFIDWEKRVRLTLPGYIGKDGSIATVMKATKQIR